MEYTSPASSDPRTPARAPLRISDAEREVIVDELGRHLTAGRLTIAEFDERVAGVYRATTRDDATAVLADLPSTPAPAPPRPAEGPFARRRPPLHQRIEWGAWATVGSINLVVWALVSWGTASLVYFWPIWVIVPWGIVLAVRTVLGVEGRPSHHTTAEHLRNARRPYREHPHCGRASRTRC